MKTHITKVVLCLLTVAAVINMTGCSVIDKFKKTDAPVEDSDLTEDIVYGQINLQTEYDQNTELKVVECFTPEVDTAIADLGFVTASGELVDTLVLEEAGDIPITVYATFEDGGAFMNTVTVHVNEVNPIKIPEEIYNWLVEEDAQFDGVITKRNGYDTIQIVPINAADLDLASFLYAQLEPTLPTVDEEKVSLIKLALTSFIPDNVTSATEYVVSNVDGQQYTITKNDQEVMYQKDDNVKARSAYRSFYTFTLDDVEYAIIKAPVSPCLSEITWTDKDLKDIDTITSKLNSWISEWAPYTATGTDIDDFTFFVVGSKDYYVKDVVTEEAESDEEQTVDTAGLTYKQEHPDLFNWPQAEIIYRKWIYSVTGDTEYQGSIIGPDGVITSTTELTSGATSNASDKSPIGELTVSDNTTLVINLSGYGYNMYSSNSGSMLNYEDSNGVIYKMTVESKAEVEQKVNNCYMTGLTNPAIAESASYITTVGRAHEYSVSYTSNNTNATGGYMVYIELSNDSSKYLVITATKPTSTVVMKSIATSITYKEN